MKSRKPKNPLRFSKAVVITMLLSCLLFTGGMIAVFCVKGAVPDTLITEFFAFFGIEGGALGVIKVAETVQEIFNKKEKKPDQASEEDNG